MFNLGHVAALLVDRCNPALKIDAGFDRAENLITGAEDALKQLELLG